MRGLVRNLVSGLVAVALVAGMTPLPAQAADARPYEGDYSERAYTYRLLVGFGEVREVRAGDAVLGVHGDVALLGFDSAADLEDARDYYEPIARFASFDGAVGIADGEGSPPDADSIEGVEATDPASASSNPIAALDRETAVEEPEWQGHLVALVDTGVAAECEAAGWTSVLGGQVYDDHGHGTDMYRAIADENPFAKVVSVKALDESGVGSVASAYAGIEQAVELGADIVNLSFSVKAAQGASAALDYVITEAARRGVAVVSAAGNDGADASGYLPGNAADSLTIGACDADGNPLPDSNYGDAVIGYVQAPSTSFAAARASGWLSMNGVAGEWAASLMREGTVLRAYRSQVQEDAQAVPGEPGEEPGRAEGAGSGEGEPDGYDGSKAVLDDIAVKTAGKAVVPTITVEVAPLNHATWSSGSNEADSGSGKASVSMGDEWWFTNIRVAISGGKDASGKKLSGGLEFAVQNYPFGWDGPNDRVTNGNVHWYSNGEWSKIQGNLAYYCYVQALGVRLTGEYAKHYDIHCKYYHSGWGKWGSATNGYDTGYTEDPSTRECISKVQVWLTAKEYEHTYQARYQKADGAWGSYTTFETASYAPGASVPPRSLDETNVYEKATIEGYTAGTGDVTKRVSVHRKKYTATFDANGGTGGATRSVFAKGALGTLPKAPVKVGYTFLGWYTEVSGGTAVSAETKMPTRNVTYYARYEAVEYSIRYVLNGGTAGERHPATAAFDEQFAVDRPAKAGSRFAGWRITGMDSVEHRFGGSAFTGAEASGITAQKFKNLRSSAGTVVFSAQWMEDDSYYIAYNANGGSGSMPTQTARMGVACTLATNAFKRSGYAFAGWNTAADGSGTAYADAASVTSLTSSKGATVTLYAQWSADGRYRVDYQLHGGSGDFPEQVKEPGRPIALHALAPTPPAQGSTPFTVTFDANGGTCPVSSVTADHVGYFMFREWNAEEAGTGASYQPGDAYAGESDLTLHAIWELAGTTDEIALPEPYRDGYEFLGWSANASATSGMTGGYTPTGDVTLHAIWSGGAQRQAYTVSYDANGGSGAPSSQVKVADEPLVLTSARPFAPASSTWSYTVRYDANGGFCERDRDVVQGTSSQMFAGWSASADGSGAGYSPGATYYDNAPVTLFAQWRTVTSVGPVELPTPVKEGSVFAGWAPDASATGGIAGTYTPTADVTLHALWVELSTSRVVYNANGGEGEPGPQDKVSGMSLVLSDVRPTHASETVERLVAFDANGGECAVADARAATEVAYDFSGWNTREDGSGTAYMPGGSYDLDEAAVLYAQWRRTVDAGEVVLPTPTREGFEFMGWATSRTARKGVTGAYAPKADVVLYAIWSNVVAGVIEVVKRGAPLGDVNADDKFPIVVELENDKGRNLDGVVVSDEDFLASPAIDPRMTMNETVANVGNVATAVGEVVGAARAASLDLDGAGRAGGDGDVVVALIDTGASDGRNVVGRESVLGGAPDDDNGHGTAMLAAMVAQNPDVKVLSIKALDERGRSTGAAVYAAVKLAIARGASIVNLSLCARDSVANRVIATAVEEAHEAGVQVVASAGNGGYDARYFVPASCDEAFTVGAADASGNVLENSNRGRHVNAFVEAGSTSEAAAKVSGWLSANLEGDWRATFAESPLPVDVGDGDIAFIGANDGNVLDQVMDQVMAAATYTMTIKFNANGGTQSTSPFTYTSGSTTVYVKVASSGIIQKSSTANGTYTDYTATLTTGTSSQLFKMIGRAGLSRTGYTSNAGTNNAKYYNTNAAQTGTFVSAASTTTKAINGNTEITANKTVTLYVVWNANTYSVSYNANGGTGAPSATSHTYNVSRALATTKPTRANYTFLGWSKSSSATTATYAAGESVKNLTATANDTVTLYAVWKENPKYTLTYNANGGTVSPTSATVYQGNSVTLPTPTRSSTTASGSTVTFYGNGGTVGGSSSTAKTATDSVSYAYNGWSTSSTATSGSKGTYTPTSSQTLYATYTQSRTLGYVAVPSASRSGYTLKGYATSSTATTPAYYAGSSYQFSANTALYAVWQEDDRKVYYGGNGGSFTPSTSPVSVTPGGYTSLPRVNGYPSGDMQDTGEYRQISYNANGGALGAIDASHSRSAQYNNYSFNGWYTSTSGGTRVGGAGDAYYPSSASSYLYMQWSNNYGWRAVTLAPSSSVVSGKPSASLGSFTVRFDANGGESTGAPGDALLAQRTRSYSFGGWNTNSVGTGTTYSAGSSYTPSGNVTLYVKWASADAAAPVVLPTPTREGYVFQGWATSGAASGGEPAGASYTPTGDVTLYATWKEAEHAVSFFANGGTGDMADQVAFGNRDYVVPDVGFSKPGYHAVWNTKADGTGVSYVPGSSTRVSAPLKLYAIWSRNAHRTITVYVRAGESASLANVPEATDYQVVDGAQPAGWMLVSASPQSGRVTGPERESVVSESRYATGTVTLDPNGGEGDYLESELLFGEHYPVPDAPYEREGYAFSGWNTAADGSGVDYQVGSTFSMEGNVVLFAQWRRHASVTLDPNGAPGDRVATPVAPGKTYRVPAAIYTREGFFFAGWNTHGDGTGDAYLPGDDMAVNADAMLYAQWRGAASGKAYAVLVDGGDAGEPGDLVLFRSDADYAHGSTGVFEDVSGTRWSGTVFTDIEETDEDGPGNCRWPGSVADILRAYVADGQSVAPVNTSYWFKDCANMTSCDLGGLDSSRVSDMGSMFENCAALASYSLRGVDTSSVADFSRMFAGCSALTALDLAFTDASAASDMAGMFEGCSALREVALGPAFSFKGAGRAYCELPEPPRTFPFTGEWTADAGKSSYAPAALTQAYGAELAGVYRWATASDALVVSFDANGGVGAMEPVVAGEAGIYAVPACGFLRDGYVFTSWNTAADGSGEELYPGRESAIQENTVLYAQWRRAAADADEGLFGLRIVNAAAGEGSAVGAYTLSFIEGGYPASGSYPFYTTDGRTGFVSNGSRVTLATGEELVVAGLPEGMSYEVEQVSAGGWLAESRDGASGTIGAGPAGYVVEDFLEWAKARPAADGEAGSLFSHYAGALARSAFGGDLPSGEALNTAVLKAVLEDDESAPLLAKGACAVLDGDPLAYYGTVALVRGYASLAAELSALSYGDIAAGLVKASGRLGLARKVQLQSAVFTNRPDDGEKAYAVLAGDELVFFRSTTSYIPGEGFFTDFAGNSYRGRLYVGVESTASHDADNAPWREQRGQIRVVRVAEEQSVSPIGTAHWFHGCGNLSDFRQDGFDMSRNLDFAGMFSGCSALVSLDISGFDTRAAESMAGMFDGCGALREVTLGQDFSFRGRSIADDAECAVLPIAPVEVPYVGAWARESAEGVPVSAEDLRDCYLADELGPGTYVWATPKRVHAVFDGEAGALRFYNRVPAPLSSGQAYYEGFDGDSLDAVAGNVPWADVAGEVEVVQVVDAGIAPEYMTAWFAGMPALESVELSRLDTRNVKSMARLFDGCSSLEVLALAGLDTSSVVTVKRMFAGCTSLKSVDVSGLSTSRLENASEMFAGCSTLASLDLTSFDASSCKDMGSMFAGCSALSSVALGEGFSFKGAGIADEALQAVLPTPPADGTYSGKWRNSSAAGAAQVSAEELRDNFEAASPDASYRPGTYVWARSIRAYAVLTGEGELVFFRSEGGYEDGFEGPVEDIAGYRYEGKVYADVESCEDGRAAPWRGERAAVLSARVSPRQTVKPSSIYAWFDGCANLTSVDFDGFDLSAVGSMRNLFRGCAAIEEIDLGSVALNVRDMRRAFSGCSSLRVLDIGGVATDADTAMDAMLAATPLLGEITVGAGFDTGNWPHASLDEVATSVEGYAGIWYDVNSNAYGLDDIPSCNANTYYASGAFVPHVAVYGQDGACAYVFQRGPDSVAEHAQAYGPLLEAYPLGDGTDPKWTQSEHAGEIEIANVAIRTSPASTAGWFEGCSRLASVVGIANLDLSGAADMHAMFKGCSSLKAVACIGLSTAHVADMSSMFEGCESLISLGNFVASTQGATDMHAMFKGCSSLVRLGLGNFDVAGVADMADMFAGCDSLEQVELGPRFSFKGSGATYCELPVAPDTKWRRIYDDELFSSSTLSAVYAPDMSGVWVRDGVYFEPEERAYAVLTDGGDLVFFRSRCEYDEGARTVATDAYLNEYEGIVFTGIEDMACPHGWSAYADAIVSARVAQNQSIAPVGMAGWFAGCGNLSSVDLRGFETGDVVDMSLLFYGCASLASLDISDFDTSSAADMSYMFGGCTALSTVTLGRDFSFKGAGIADVGMQALLPTPADEAYTGKWMRLGGSGEALSASTLRDTYNPDGMSGTWTLELAGRAYGVLDAQGNLVLFKSDELYERGSGSAVYTDVDGNAYEGVLYTGIETTNVYGSGNCPWADDVLLVKTVRIPAGQVIKPVNTGYWFGGCVNLERADLAWLDTTACLFMTGMFEGCANLDSVALGHAFRFDGNGLVDDVLKAELPIPPALAFTGRWALEGTQGVAATARELRDCYLTGELAAGTYMRERTVKVSFDANGGEGQMPDAYLAPGEAYSTPDCSFTRYGYRFAGWNAASDGSGEAVAPGGDVAAEGDVVLYAQWDGIQLEFSVPTVIPLGMKADGSFVRMSDETFSIENRSAASLTVSGVGVVASEGVEVGDNTSTSGGAEGSSQGRSFNASLLLAGEGDFRFSSLAESGFVEPVGVLDWLVGSGESMSVDVAEAVGSGFGDIGEDSVKVAAIQWKVSLPETSMPFEANGGTGDMAVQHMNVGCEAVLPACGYEREGYAFAGWNTSPFGVGHSYAAGEHVRFDDFPRLYAMWTPVR